MSEENDGFGSLDLSFYCEKNEEISETSETISTLKGLKSKSSKISKPKNYNTSNDKVRKHGLQVMPELSVTVGIVHTLCGHLPETREFLLHFIMHVYGQRNLKKQAVTESQLTMEQKDIYAYIMKQLNNPVRQKRVFEFINNDKKITRRLINYFVVHYALNHEMSYFLDRRSYPYQIIGTLNNPHQPDITSLIEKGEDIVYINFYQEYKNSKRRNGRRNMHAPYRRLTSVKGEDGQEYSLCELNFYLWLDEVGGFELFYMFENDIRAKKAEDARKKRQRDETADTPNKRRKQKVILQKTEGQNYKTYVTTHKLPPIYFTNFIV